MFKCFMYDLVAKVFSRKQTSVSTGSGNWY